MRSMLDKGRRTRATLARLFGGRHAEVLTYCDRCAELCDRRCRGEAAREQARTQAAHLLMRPF